MLNVRYSVLWAALVAALMIAMDAGRLRAAGDDKTTAAQEKQAKLIGVLKSDAPPQDKAMACKQLALCGTDDAVGALTPLLADEKLAAWARIALEVIPGPGADEALLQSAGKLQGRLLIGVIHSMGVRHDAKAIDLLVERLKDPDAEVASAAAVVLGRIGGDRAETVLRETVVQGPTAIRSAAAEGYILCAERSLAAGKLAEAVKMYDLVRKTDVPKQRVLEATRGAILARQTAGVPLLVEQLRSADKGRFEIGLRTAREMSGREVTDALVAELATAARDRQALLILALADRADATALPAVLQAAKSGPGEARIAAMRVLKRLGDASCVPVLLDAAQQADPELSEAALAVLADLPDEGVSADLAARLAAAQGKTRQVLIQLAGRRNIAAAVPGLVKAADDPDAQIRTAALTALGATIQFGDLQVLIGRVADAQKAPEETKAAVDALRVACERMPDREACAERLVAAMSRATVPAKCRLLEVLGVLGGAKALGAVGAAAKDASPEMQDTASRLLGEWMSLDAAPVLLDLAKTATDAKYESRALRGYIRLARQFTMPEAQRAEMCGTALQTAKRDAEKKLVLEVIERYPSIDMLRLAVDAAKTPSLKADAAATSLVVAQKISGNSADVQKLLAQVGQDPVKVEIIKAEYGEGAKLKDVTETLRQHVRDLPLIVLPSPDYNSSFGGDPAPGIVKQLKIQYRLNGKAAEVSLPENAAIMLPVPK